MAHVGLFACCSSCQSWASIATIDRYTYVHHQIFI